MEAGREREEADEEAGGGGGEEEGDCGGAERQGHSHMSAPRNVDEVQHWLSFLISLLVFRKSLFWGLKIKENYHNDSSNMATKNQRSNSFII